MAHIMVWMLLLQRPPIPHSLSIRKISVFRLRMNFVSVGVKCQEGKCCCNSRVDSRKLHGGSNPVVGIRARLRDMIFFFGQRKCPCAYVCIRRFLVFNFFLSSYFLFLIVIHSLCQISELFCDETLNRLGSNFSPIFFLILLLHEGWYV